MAAANDFEIIQRYGLTPDQIEKLAGNSEVRKELLLKFSIEQKNKALEIAEEQGHNVEKLA